MQTIKEKLTSRKFWLAVATMLFGFGSVISGTNLGIPRLTECGYILIALGFVVYAVVNGAQNVVKMIIDAKTAVSDGVISDEEIALLKEDFEEIKESFAEFETSAKNLFTVASTVTSDDTTDETISEDTDETVSEDTDTTTEAD